MSALLHPGMLLGLICPISRATRQPCPTETSELWEFEVVI